MLILLYIICFLLLNCILCGKYDKKIVEMQPFTFSILILLLYVLAFFNHMWFLDEIVAILLVCEIIYFVKKGKEFTLVCLKKICSPSFMIFCGVSIVGIIALSSRALMLSDEYNFWGVDIKSLYCLQGYAAKGLNCSPGYGDYPPAYQLFAALFLHLINRIDEGAMFSAYFFATQIFLMPLIVNIPSKLFVYMTTFVWLFVSFSFGPDMWLVRSPDVLLGIIYGCALVFGFRKDKQWLDYFGLSAIFSVLVLTKSIGIQWFAFAVIFLLGLNISRHVYEKKAIICLIIPLVFYGSWQLFCRIMERSTYLIAQLNNSLKGTYDDIADQYEKKLFFSFIQALFRKQQISTLGVGLSIFGCFCIFIILIYIFKVIRKIDCCDFKIILGFIVFSGIIEYASLLFSVETMFIGEAATYSDANQMLGLLKRYGAPYIIGSYMLVLEILLNSKPAKVKDKNVSTVAYRTWLIVTIIGILICPLKQQWLRLWSYRNNEDWVEKTVLEKEPELEPTVCAIDALRDPYEQRLYVVVDEEYHEFTWNSRLNLIYYATPTFTSLEVISSRKPEDFIRNVLWNSYTAICYVSKNPNWAVLNSISTVNGEKVAANKIYYIQYDETEIMLAE